MKSLLWYEIGASKRSVSPPSAAILTGGWNRDKKTSLDRRAEVGLVVIRWFSSKTGGRKCSIWEVMINGNLPLLREPF